MQFPPHDDISSAELRIYLCNVLQIPAEIQNLGQAQALGMLETHLLDREGINVERFFQFCTALSVELWDTAPANAYPVVTQESVDRLTKLVGFRIVYVALLRNGLFPQHDPSRGCTIYSSAPRHVTSYTAHEQDLTKMEFDGRWLFDPAVVV